MYISPVDIAMPRVGMKNPGVCVKHVCSKTLRMSTPAVKPIDRGSGDAELGKPEILPLAGDGVASRFKTWLCHPALPLCP
jgi:hypothetical protein